MDVNNLTNVYNQNPTLQGSYTLPEYLALFGQGGTSTPAQTPDPTPTPDPGQGIINANINQYQQGRDDGDNYTGFGDFGNLDESTAKTQFADVSDGKGGSYVKEFTTYMDPGGMRKTIDGKNIYHGDLNTVGGMILDGITGNKKTNKLGYKTAGSTYGTFSKRPDLTNAYGIPYTDLNLFGKIKTKFKRNQELKDFGKLAIEQQQLKERIEKEQAAAQERQAAADQSRVARAYREDTGGNAGSYAPGGGSGSHAADASGSTYSDPFDPGGGEKDGGYIDGSNRRKDFKNGGATNGSSKAALSAKVKELMDDGYEFGEAVKEAMKQGYMNGGRIKSYFKGGIAGFKNGGRINFRGGGSYQGGRSSSSSSSSSSSKSSGPAGGASAGGNYGGNRNPNQTYGGGGGGGPKPGSGRVNTVNRFGPKNKSFFDKINIHSTNNAKLEKAYRDKVIDSDEYNVLGGLSSKRDLGFGPIRTAAASTAYNLVQSALGPKFTRGNQPLFDGASDVGRNTFGSNLEPDSALAKQYDEIMKTYKKGGRVRSYFKGGLVSLRGR